MRISRRRRNVHRHFKIQQGIFHLLQIFFLILNNIKSTLLWKRIKRICFGERNLCRPQWHRSPVRQTISNHRTYVIERFLRFLRVRLDWSECEQGVGSRRVVFFSSCKSAHVFPTFNFTRVHETLKNLASLQYTPPAVDVNNNAHSCVFDEPFERSLNKHTYLRDTSHTVMLDDDRNNPQSPLHSVKTFEELKLNTQLLNGIYNMGFRRPSRIQERALPQLLAYPPRNMIAQSQNGTGKTVDQKKSSSLDCISVFRPLSRWRRWAASIRNWITSKRWFYLPPSN